MTMSRKEHWEHVYETKSPTELSWFQAVPSKSMAMIREILAGVALAQK